MMNIEIPCVLSAFTSANLAGIIITFSNESCYLIPILTTGIWWTTFPSWMFLSHHVSGLSITHAFSGAIITSALFYLNFGGVIFIATLKTYSLYVHSFWSARIWPWLPCSKFAITLHRTKSSLSTCVTFKLFSTPLTNMFYKMFSFCQCSASGRTESMFSITNLYKFLVAGFTNIFGRYSGFSVCGSAFCRTILMSVSGFIIRRNHVIINFFSASFAKESYIISRLFFISNAFAFRHILSPKSAPSLKGATARSAVTCQRFMTPLKPCGIISLKGIV